VRKLERLSDQTGSIDADEERQGTGWSQSPEKGNVSELGGGNLHPSLALDRGERRNYAKNLEYFSNYLEAKDPVVSPSQLEVIGYLISLTSLL
jgi:hypothetical protein